MSIGILSHFLSGLLDFFFFTIEFYEFLIFWILTIYWLMIYKYFLPFHRSSFYFLMVSFTVQKLSSLMWSNLWIFACIACAFSIKKEKIMVETNAKELPPSFSSRDFMVSGLTFKWKSILSSFFVSDVRESSNFFLFLFLVCYCSIFPTPLIEETVVSSLNILSSPVKYSV